MIGGEVISLDARSCDVISLDVWSCDPRLHYFSGYQRSNYSKISTRHADEWVKFCTRQIEKLVVIKMFEKKKFKINHSISL